MIEEKQFQELKEIKQFIVVSTQINKSLLIEIQAIRRLLEDGKNRRD